MSVKKNLLKKLTLLYVEDDDPVRTELSKLLSEFFSNVYIAKDGKEGFEIFEKQKIDMILTDINMPQLSGIEMVKKIREKDKEIPVIMATAYSDNELLLSAIKLKVQEYIIKPVDVRKLISLMNEVAKNIYQKIYFQERVKELERYKEITETNNIVIKIDTNMKITYVNELFSEISGFLKEDLIGKDLKFLKHQDISDNIYKEIYKNILKNKPWKGVLKNIKKDGTAYTTDCFFITTLDDDGEILGAISIQKDITEELNKKREVQLALMKDKSEIFIKSKEGSAEQNAIINELRQKLETSQSELQKALKNIDEYSYSIEKYKLDNRNLTTEVSLLRKNATSSINFKFSKENSDLKVEIKRLKEKLENIEYESEKANNQLKVNYEEKIEKLNEEINSLTKQLDSIHNDEVLVEKLEYWKEKAKNETKRIESLEKQILEHADSSFMSKIFS